MPLGQMQIDHRVFEFDVPEQQLNRPQVGPGLHQVRGVRMAQEVRRHALLKLGARRGVATGIPHDLRRDRFVGAPVLRSCPGNSHVFGFIQR
jgi:hypothetical protein